MSTDFEGLLHALDAGGVEFILIGGLAGIVHGSARATYDVDVVYARTPENIHRLAAALAPLKPYLRGAPPGASLDKSGVGSQDPVAALRRPGFADVRTCGVAERAVRLEPIPATP